MLSTVPGDTDILFSEMMWNGQFYATPVLVSIVPAGLGFVPDSAHNPALGARPDGAPYVAWTDMREAGAAHIYFAEAMGAPCKPPPSPIVISSSGTTGGQPMKFLFGNNPHFTEVDISVPDDAFGTSISLMVNELTNPVVECPGGSTIFAAAGSGLYLNITGGSGCGGTDCNADALGDWITVTIHLAPGATLASSVGVYRLVPPTLASLGAYTWRTDLIQGVHYDPNANTLTFETKHLSSFGVGAGTASGGGGGGGCAMSRGGAPDLFTLLLPVAAIGLCLAARLNQRKKSANH